MSGNLDDKYRPGWFVVRNHSTGCLEVKYPPNSGWEVKEFKADPNQKFTVPSNITRIVVGQDEFVKLAKEKEIETEMSQSVNNPRKGEFWTNGNGNKIEILKDGMQIDWCGRFCQILAFNCTLGNVEYFRANGTSDTYSNLIGLYKEKIKVEGWVNAFGDGRAAGFYSSKEAAERNTHPDIIARVFVSGEGEKDIV